MSHTINLAAKNSYPEVASPLSASKDRVSYPTLYVSGIDKVEELPDGEFTFTGKAKLVSKTETNRNGKETCSFEIEVHEITPTSKGVKSKGKDSGESLDNALTVIESSKEDMDESDDE